MLLSDVSGGSLLHPWKSYRLLRQKNLCFFLSCHFYRMPDLFFSADFSLCNQSSHPWIPVRLPSSAPNQNNTDILSCYRLSQQLYPLLFSPTPDTLPSLSHHTWQDCHTFLPLSPKNRYTLHPVCSADLPVPLPYPFPPDPSYWWIWTSVSDIFWAVSKAYACVPAPHRHHWSPGLHNPAPVRYVPSLPKNPHVPVYPEELSPDYPSLILPVWKRSWFLFPAPIRMYPKMHPYDPPT